MTVKPLKVVIGSLVKDDFAAIQRKPKAQARAELQQLKERVQRLEITSRMYTGKKARTRSGREGVELLRIQKQIKSPDLQEIIDTQDDYECAGKIDTLAGKILGGQAPGLKDKVQTIPLEKTVQRTLDLFNEGAAALEALIENPADEDAKAALERANQELQAMLPKETPGILSRLSGATSSVVTNITQRLKTLEMRRIARDYGVPVVLGAVSHMTEHPEMLATYLGLSAAVSFVRSCRKPQASKQLAAPKSPFQPAAVTVVQRIPAPALVNAEQEVAPAADLAPAPSDLAREENAQAEEQDKDLPPAPSNTPEPVVAATESETQVASPKPEAPAITSSPAALPLTSAPSEAALGDQVPPVGVMTHHLKPKISAPKRRAAKIVPFTKDAPQQLAKPQARTPSPVALSLSPAPSDVTISQSPLPAVGNPGSAFKPLGKTPALGFALPLASQAAAQAAQLKKPAVVAASHTAPAHMSALQPAKKAAILPYYVTTGDASQFQLGAKYACNFITGYLQIRMHEAAKEKRSLTSEDLNFAMMQGASAYEGCLKHYNEETGSKGHHAFTWQECLDRDKYLSSQIRPVDPEPMVTVVAAPKATNWGTFPPISDTDFNNIFGAMIQAADAAPGALIAGTVTFGSDSGVAESFPVGIRKVFGGYEYIFGNSHGTDIGSDSIQVNRFNPVVQNYKTHFQRYLAQRLSAVKASPQGTIGVEVSINQVRV